MAAVRGAGTGHAPWANAKLLKQHVDLVRQGQAGGGVP
jgi:hypothetical protein